MSAPAITTMSGRSVCSTSIGALLRREHVGQPAIDVRAFVEPAAAQDDALLAHPGLHHLAARPAPGAMHLAGPAIHLARRRGARHHAARAVHGREQRVALQRARCPRRRRPRRARSPHRRPSSRRRIPSDPGNAGVAPLRTTTSVFAVVLLRARRSCDGCARARARARRGATRPCAPPTRGRRRRTRRPASSAPSSRGPSADRAASSTSRSGTRAPHFSPCDSARKPDATVCPKPRLPKCTPTQIASALVDEDVDVVIAAADRAELLARLVAQVARARAAARVPRRATRTADDRPAHRPTRFLRPMPNEMTSWISSASSREAAGEARRAVQRQIGANRGVAAGDVEADADDRHLLAVGGDAADRHDVAEVAVGHERGALGAAGDVLELRQRVRLVLAEDRRRCFVQCASSSFTRCPHSTRTTSRPSSVTSIGTSTNCADHVDVRQRVTRQRQRRGTMPPSPSARIGSS